MQFTVYRMNRGARLTKLFHGVVQRRPQISQRTDPRTRRDELHAVHRANHIDLCCPWEGASCPEETRSFEAYVVEASVFRGLKVECDARWLEGAPVAADHVI